MKILYIASIRLPTEKAHGIQIMKTCEAFALQGVDIKLCVPNFLFSLNKVDFFSFYKIKNIFRIKKVLSLRLIYLGPIGYFLETLIFFIMIFFSKSFWEADFIFTRDEVLAWLSTLFGKKVVWETHTGNFNFFVKRTAKRLLKIIAISQGLKDLYVSKGIASDKILVCRDAVDIKDFDLDISKIDARRKMDLPLDKKIVLYAGRLDGWKGIVTLLDASKNFKEDILVVVVGGDENQVLGFKTRYPKVMFLGFKPYNDLPMYQKAADVLVLPNTGQNQISRLFTSPLKLFTYMASRVPIVASDLPSIREVLDNSSAVFVNPDDPQDLLKGVESVLGGAVNADIITKNAFAKVQGYTWVSRVNEILKSLN